MAIEYRTLPLIDVLKTARAGNWVHHHGDLESPDCITVLPWPGSIWSLPFLAQYLVQAIIAPDDTPVSRWRAGNGAYRLAVAQVDAAPRQLILEV
jgi:hypothetical protein